MYSWRGSARDDAGDGEIDESAVKTYPVLAVDGIRVVSGEFGPRQIELTGSRSFGNGAVVSKFARKR